LQPAQGTQFRTAQRMHGGNPGVAVMSSHYLTILIRLVTHSRGNGEVRGTRRTVQGRFQHLIRGFNDGMIGQEQLDFPF
jgi:hypothetical protein